MPTNLSLTPIGIRIHVDDDLPPDETPVLVLIKGKWYIGALFWDHPGHEDNYAPYQYWDDPNNDGQCWEWGDITHWARLPPTGQQPSPQTHLPPTHNAEQAP